MNTFERIATFFVPAQIAMETDTLLQAAGRTGHERFVLWTGTVESDGFQVRTLHMPKQSAYKGHHGLMVSVDGDELHRLNVWLYENGETLAIQVHSHPTEAFHSETDDAYAMVTTLGGLSLVVPDFARRGVQGPGTALYRLDHYGWQGVDPDAAAALLRYHD